MQRPALNFYVKFTPGNFKGSGSTRRASAIFGSASFALQNFISAFKFYLRDLALLLKFTPQKLASVFKFSPCRFALNLRSTLRAVFAATRTLPAKILSRIISLSQIVAQNFGKNLEINSAEAKILRKNHALKFIVPFAMKNPAPQNFARLNLAASQNLSPLNSAFKFKASADV